MPATRTPSRLVILGDATRGVATDLVNVPGYRDPVPGVYMLVCAALTKARAPLFIPSALGRCALALAVAAIVAAFTTMKRRALAALLATLTCFALGGATIYFARLIWTDFFVVPISATLIYHWGRDQFFAS